MAVKGIKGLGIVLFRARFYAFDIKQRIWSTCTVFKKKSMYLDSGQIC